MEAGRVPADAAVRSGSVHAILSLRVLNSSTDRGERGRALRSSASRPDGGVLRLLLLPGAHTEAAKIPVTVHLASSSCLSSFANHRRPCDRTLRTSGARLEPGRKARRAAGTERRLGRPRHAAASVCIRSILVLSGKVFWHNMRSLARGGRCQGLMACLRRPRASPRPG